jgi:hypothetical protein
MIYLLPSSKIGLSNTIASGKAFQKQQFALLCCPRVYLYGGFLPKVIQYENLAIVGNTVCPGMLPR